MPDSESSVCDMIVFSPAHNSNYRGTNENYTCRSSPLTPREISGATVGAKRKRAAMETSTPTQLLRETKLIDLGESPIEQAPSDHDSRQDSTGGSGKAGLGRAGISGEVDSMAVTPPKEISPNTENIKLYKGARNITNAAERSGFIECATAREVDIETDLVENSMFSAYTSRQVDEDLSLSLEKVNLSPWNGEEDNLQARNGVGIGIQNDHDVLVTPNRDENPTSMLDSSITLGSRATRSILDSRAIPMGISPKRKLEISPSTPMSAARRYSFSGASPTLRAMVVTNQQDGRKNLVGWLNKLKGGKADSPVSSISNSAVGYGGGARRTKCVGTRIAARFSNRDSPARKQKKRNNVQHDQPLIRDSLRKLEDRQANVGDDSSVQFVSMSSNQEDLNHVTKSLGNGQGQA